MFEHQKELALSLPQNRGRKVRDFCCTLYTQGYRAHVAYYASTTCARVLRTHVSPKLIDFASVDRHSIRDKQPRYRPLNTNARET